MGSRKSRDAIANEMPEPSGSALSSNGTAPGRKRK